MKQELYVIKQAIINEVEGYEFYKMAANQAGTSESKEAFLELAQEELKHVEYLESLMNKIQNETGEDLRLAFEVNPPSPNIYNWKKIDKEFASMAMAVFGIGIQMEKDSIEFYEKAKSETTLEEAKLLYDLLIKWEKVHLEQFTQQYDSYKDDWWFDQGYAPF